MSGFKKNSQKALPPAGSKEVTPDGYQKSRTDSKKHGADTNRPFSKESLEASAKMWDTVVHTAGEAFRLGLANFMDAIAYKQSFETINEETGERTFAEGYGMAVALVDKCWATLQTNVKKASDMEWLKARVAHDYAEWNIDLREKKE